MRDTAIQSAEPRPIRRSPLAGFLFICAGADERYISDSGIERARSATLEHFRGAVRHGTVTLKASFGVCTVGSGTESNVRLDDSSFDPEHFVFGNEAGRWWVALARGARSASTDGQMLTSEPRWLQDGSSIKTGQSTLMLRTEG